jgi:hypothetical protein
MSPWPAGRKAAGIMRYSAIIATLALFVALGGSAAAVSTFPRDSVGAPQIRKDAVRSPEIAKDAVRAPEIAKDAVRSPEIATDAVRSPEIATDAVRSPEIAAGAVRSSELRDGAVQLADISPHAQQALTGAPGPAGVAEARIAENAAAGVDCRDQGLTSCPNLLARTVGTGSWIVEAKLDVANGGPPAPADACGLVQGTTVLDSAGVSLDGGGSPPDIETIALSGVIKSSAQATIVGLRCAAQAGERVIAQHMRITALQVQTIIGP